MRPFINYRSYQPSDAASLAELYTLSVTTLGPTCYSQAQVVSWASLAPSPSEMHRRCSDGRRVVVAALADEKVVAFGDIEADGHIGYLYCSPEYVRMGIASSIYARLEEMARLQGCMRVYVEASELARGFFRGKGFSLSKRREVRIGNITVHNYAMEKLICRDDF